VVLVALDHACAAVEKGLGEARIAAQASQVGVALDVGLVYDVEPVLVAQLVPVGVVGVVGRTHGVEVELLHAPDVGEHALASHGLAALVVVIVPVDALDENRAPVDQELAPPHLDPAKADTEAHCLPAPSHWILERDDQAIELGILRRPARDARDRRSQLDSGALVEIGIAGGGDPIPE